MLPPDKKSETPMCDALEFRDGVVGIEFARQLERELASLQASVKAGTATALVGLSASSAELPIAWRWLAHPWQEKWCFTESRPTNLGKEAVIEALYKAPSARNAAVPTPDPQSIPSTPEEDWKGPYVAPNCSGSIPSSTATHPDTIALQAWHRVFETSQLSHAHARLQAAEEKVARFERSAPSATQRSDELLLALIHAYTKWEATGEGADEIERIANEAIEHLHRRPQQVTVADVVPSVGTTERTASDS